MKTSTKLALTGFGFGTAGLYVLAALALALPAIENFSGILMYPARLLATSFVGEETSISESFILWLFSGVLYSLIFYFGGALIIRYAQDHKKKR